MEGNRNFISVEDSVLKLPYIEHITGTHKISKEIIINALKDCSDFNHLMSILADESDREKFFEGCINNENNRSDLNKARKLLGLKPYSFIDLDLIILKLKEKRTS